jgi:predicted amidohydrolase
MTTMRQMMTERGATKTKTVRITRIKGRLMLSPSSERAAVGDAASIDLADLDGRTVTVDGETATLRVVGMSLRVVHPALGSTGYEPIEMAWDMVADAEVG